MLQAVKKTTSIQKLRNDIRHACTNDYRRLTKVLNQYLKNKDPQLLKTLKIQLTASLEKVAVHKKNKPTIHFSDQLPISQRRKEIAELIKHNQILIVAGETGSGKTTQLPKICLELGLGCRGLIGHTQPRRIAARTVAERIAKELNTPLGETVGYQVRFKKSFTDKTQIKLMTDGVLLSEIHNDRLLSRYEVIIIDEAHERSLNIDFLLGLLINVCSKRPDLKVIITSATIDLEKFSQHFATKKNGELVPAPIIEVSGRTYPVEVTYKPINESSLALEASITEAVEEIIQSEQQGIYKAKGDILIFCSGEREIRASADALKKATLNIDILPLYSRLSVAEQNKVFQPSAKRKVVLATNVAETSITVPGISYVIDPGFARVSRYSFKSKIQRLPIEPISQASANQRMGRCGRVANGVCIRLYSEEDFNTRSAFTSAEILRSNLASVILKMRHLGIKDIHTFPFVDAPDIRLLNDGIKLLQELYAIDKQQHITQIGKQLSRLPIDPKYARILVEANTANCLADALVIVSALSIQDPRERPADFKQKADEKHRMIQHPQSDFFSYLYLWQLIINKRSQLTNAQFKKFCQTHFLSVGRVFEWRELQRQLKTICKELNWVTPNWDTLSLPSALSETETTNRKNKLEVNSKPEFDSRYITLHKVLLSGLVSNIATQSLDKYYVATRNRKALIFPSSALVKKNKKRQAKWILASEFLETSKTFMLTVAEIEPDWVIEASQHLCKYSYSDPFYSQKTGYVQAKRKTILSGLTLRENEYINYAKINPKQARELFIQRGLVEGSYLYRPKNKTTKLQSFSQHNQKQIMSIKAQEHKLRKGDFLISDEAMFDLYAEHIPENVVSRASFEKWYRNAIITQPRLLFFNRSNFLSDRFDSSELAQFPNHLSINEKRFKLRYTFDPQSPEDGVSLSIPHNLLKHFPDTTGSWLIPGLLHEKCVALLKTLPKNLRKQLVPITNTVTELMPDLIHNQKNLPYQEIQKSLEEVLCHQVLRTTGVNLSVRDFDFNKLDSYYLMNYRIMKQNGQLLTQSRNLIELKNNYADTINNSLGQQQVTKTHTYEVHNIKQWDFGELAASYRYESQGMTVTAFPMLQIQADKSISKLLCYDKDLAVYFTKQALIALSKQQNIHGKQKQTTRYLEKELFKFKQKNITQKNSLSLAEQLSQLKRKHSQEHNESNANNFTQWIQPVIAASLWQCCFKELNQLPRNQVDYEHALENSRQWVSTAMAFEKILDAALQQKNNLLESLATIKVNSALVENSISDIRSQLDELFEKNILDYTYLDILKEYPRYLAAIQHRIDKIHIKQPNDSLHQLKNIQASFQKKLNEHLETLNARQPVQHKLAINAVYSMYPQFVEFAHMLQEWRVSIFAQHLKTKTPVSYKRVKKAAEKILVPNT